MDDINQPRDGGSGGRPSTSNPRLMSSFPSEEIYLTKAIESHSLELDSLQSECKTKLPKLMSQRLPRFMRRRASSHNPKRVPKSIRQLIVDKRDQSLNTSKVQKNVKNRKKYVNKRKHESSLKRREAKNERSVLHVWFAKRFKMINNWNRLIPLKNNTKNERLLYHNSKNDFVFYYLSFYDCIEIDYSMSSREQLIAYLMKFSHSDIGCSFGAKIYESGNREGMAVLYNYDSYPLDPLVFTYFLWNQSLSKLWIWSHISVVDKVLQTLISCSETHYSNQFEINCRKKLERLRVIGPKALNSLSKCLKYDFEENLKLEELNVDSVHHFQCNENITSLIESNKSNLFKDISESIPKQKSLNSFEFVLILKNKTFKNRFALDLIVLRDSAKILWNKLTANKVHRVGGYHDLQSIALNTSSLLFPKFGFIDVEENKTKIEKLKTLLNMETNETFYVLRNQLIISKLATNLCSFTFKNIFHSFQHKSKALINVEVFCLNRGVPQEWDQICIPTETDIKNIFNKSFDEDLNEMKRKTIGLIEFGKYSLETSHGKGFGIITLNGLEELIEINEKFNSIKSHKNNTIFGTFFSIKSLMYRMIGIKVIETVFST